LANKKRKQYEKNMVIHIVAGKWYFHTGPTSNCPGAELNISGTTQLTISNMDFINNGRFTAGNGIESCTGNTSSVLRGSQATSFNNVEINKNGGAALTLQRTIIAALVYTKAGIASFDATTICLVNKYNFNLVRPISYIREVMGYTTWIALFNTLGHPEFPSAHAINGAAIASPQL
jgi:hypothetical protein